MLKKSLKSTNLFQYSVLLRKKLAPVASQELSQGGVGHGGFSAVVATAKCG